MTPAQAAMCKRIRAAMAEFYKSPENERRFRQWRSSRGGGRVAAGKHATCLVTVRYRTVPILADGRPRGALEWMLAALGIAYASGVPTAAACALATSLDPLPSWVVLVCLIAVMAGGTAWIWRAL